MQLGDGTSVTLTSTANANGRIIADPNGGFDVQISHVYLKVIAGGTFSVQVNGPGGQTTRINTDTFSVADAPLTAGQLTPPAAKQYQAIKNATIFHFTDGNPLSTADAYTAVVNLGDGNQVTFEQHAQSIWPRRGQSKRRLRCAVVVHIRHVVCESDVRCHGQRRRGDDRLGQHEFVFRGTVIARRRKPDAPHRRGGHTD